MASFCKPSFGELRVHSVGSHSTCYFFTVAFSVSNSCFLLSFVKNVFPESPRFRDVYFFSYHFSAPVGFHFMNGRQ